MRVFFYKGSWYYEFEAGKHPKSGKRKQKKKGGFETKKEATAAGREAVYEYQKGLLTDTEKITFGEMADIWLNEYSNKNYVKNSTIRVREKERNVWLKYFDKIQFQQIDRKLIQDALNDMQTKYKPNSLSGIFATLKMIFKKAKELNIIRLDATEFAYIPRTRKTLEEIEQEPVERKYLEKDTLKNFLTIARKFGLKNDYLFFTLLAYTGLRQGEAIALKWTDIDFDNETISVNRTIFNPSNNTRNFKLETPKTATSIRTITIDGKLIEELKKHRLTHKEFYFANRHVKNFDFVFIKEGEFAGYPLNPKDVQSRLERLVKIAKLNQRVTPHTFRHTHTSLLAEAGVDLVTIMDRLGHKDDSITRDIYLHITKQVKKEAAHKFSQLMNDL
jgi:integrase